MTEIPRKLDLPLFISSSKNFSCFCCQCYIIFFIGNRIRANRLEELKEHIKNQAKQYTKKCKEGKLHKNYIQQNSILKKHLCF